MLERASRNGAACWGMPHWCRARRRSPWGPAARGAGARWYLPGKGPGVSGAGSLPPPRRVATGRRMPVEAGAPWDVLPERSGSRRRWTAAAHPRTTSCLSIGLLLYTIYERVERCRQDYCTSEISLALTAQWGEEELGVREGTRSGVEELGCRGGPGGRKS